MSDHSHATSAGGHSHAGRYLLVWGSLMALTALTWGLSTVHIHGVAGRGRWRSASPR